MKLPVRVYLDDLINADGEVVVTTGSDRVLFGSRQDDIHLAEIALAVNCHLELVRALEALGAKPDGYCYCATVEQIANGHTGECKDAQAVLAKAAGGVLTIRKVA